MKYGYWINCCCCSKVNILSFKHIFCESTRTPLFIEHCRKNKTNLNKVEQIRFGYTKFRGDFFFMWKCCSVSFSSLWLNSICIQIVRCATQTKYVWDWVCYHQSLSDITDNKLKWIRRIDLINKNAQWLTKNSWWKNGIVYNVFMSSFD